jgi:hypothetical protein
LIPSYYRIIPSPNRIHFACGLFPSAGRFFIMAAITACAGNANLLSRQTLKWTTRQFGEEKGTFWIIAFWPRAGDSMADGKPPACGPDWK